MKSRQRTVRMICSGALFAATLALGVYAYKDEIAKQEKVQQESVRQEEELKNLTEELTEHANTSNAKADLQGETPEITAKDADAAGKDPADQSTEGKNTEGQNTEAEGKNIEGQNTEGQRSNHADAADPAATGATTGATTGAAAEQENGGQSTEDKSTTESGHASQESSVPPADEDADTTASGAILPALDFNEGTVLNAPVVGQTLIPYSMDATVYFSTLNQYRYNPSVVIAAEMNTPVVAAANSQVISVEEDTVTGTTVTMDMGNGFQAVYGQLANLTVEPGQTIEQGTVIGVIDNPTMYYTQEGANLYFAMKKDGTPVDPALYLPSTEE